ncbi:unnamed protein product, partial [Symbiodinium sp. CCMP2456]
EALLWQSRTRFGGIAQDWTTYPREAQAQLNRALVRGDRIVELCFHGSRFRVDLVNKKQYNATDMTKVRDVRLVNVQPKMWLLISKSEEAHWVVLDEANCKHIEEGLGERHLCHDAVLFEISNRRLGRLYIDKARQRAYDSLYEDAFRGLLALPRSMWAAVQECPQDVTLPPSSEWHQLLFRHFEATKFGGRKGKRVLNEDLFVGDITCHLRKRLYLQFLEKVHRFSERGRVLLCFHGTKPQNRAEIVDNGFSISKVGAGSGNHGWFGKGIYFGRRAYTALGYNRGAELLCCLVAVQDVFVTPPPDSSGNAYHGLPCKLGYDAHLSPSGKELVLFNPRQILPCFTLHLSKYVELSDQQAMSVPASTYDKSSPSDYRPACQPLFAETAWQRQKEAQQKHDEVELLYAQLQELTQQKHAEEARARRHAQDVQRAKLEFEEATRKLRAAESELWQRQEEQRREEEAERLRREEEQARRIEEEVEKRIQDKVQAELHRRLAAEERRLRDAEEDRRRQEALEAERKRIVEEDVR